MERGVRCGGSGWGLGYGGLGGDGSGGGGGEICYLLHHLSSQ